MEYSLLNAFSSCDNLVYLKGKLGKYSSKIEFLIDIGATINFISETMVENYSILTSPYPSQRIILADGKTDYACVKKVLVKV